MARMTKLELATSGVTGQHSNQLNYTPISNRSVSEQKTVARMTRLELATSGVTGQRSNQLSYTPTFSNLIRAAPRMRLCLTDSAGSVKQGKTVYTENDIRKQGSKDLDNGGR